VSVKFRRDVAGHTNAQYIQVVAEQIGPDPINDGGDVAFHTRHVRDRQTKAQESGWILHVNVLQERCRAGDFFEETRDPRPDQGEQARVSSRSSGLGS